MVLMAPTPPSCGAPKSGDLEACPIDSRLVPFANASAERERIAAQNGAVRSHFVRSKEARVYAGENTLALNTGVVLTDKS